uniref:Uncharacterized protein n=1 Tax=Trichuris muris TaxID=70415 RepID=A0A5S6Q7R1_TRIMR
MSIRHTWIGEPRRCSSHVEASDTSFNRDRSSVVSRINYRCFDVDNYNNTTRKGATKMESAPNLIAKRSPVEHDNQ